MISRRPSNCQLQFKSQQIRKCISPVNFTGSKSQRKQLTLDWLTSYFLWLHDCYSIKTDKSLSVISLRTVWSKNFVRIYNQVCKKKDTNKESSTWDNKSSARHVFLKKIIDMCRHSKVHSWIGHCVHKFTRTPAYNYVFLQVTTSLFTFRWSIHRRIKETAIHLINIKYLCV